MADILIRGVGMPHNDDDYVIFTVYGDGGVVYGPLNRPHVRYKHRAVPFPEGHGRLIDADRMITRLEKISFRSLEEPVYSLTFRDLFDAYIYDLQHEPAIIPAEGGIDNE